MEKMEVIDYLVKQDFKNGKASKTKVIKALSLERSTYYAVKNHKQSKAKIRKIYLSKMIKRLFDKFNQIYGAPKILAEILKLHPQLKGLQLRTVSNYMQEMGLRAITVPTTYKVASKGTSQLPFNLPFINYIKFDKPIKPHTHILTDITYIHTIEDGWVYKLTFMDLFTRKVLRWSVSNEMTAEWVIGITNDLIDHYKSIDYIHSDRGSQYTSKEYVKLLLINGISPSYSAKGYPYHNAWIESYHAQLKKECIYRVKIRNIDEVKDYCFRYIEGFYNTIRSQKALGYVSPNEYEKMN